MINALLLMILIFLSLELGRVYLVVFPLNLNIKRVNKLNLCSLFGLIFLEKLVHLVFMVSEHH
jgi:hypothetical protein